MSRFTQITDIGDNPYHGRAILTTVFLGSCFAILISWGLASLFGPGREIVLSLLPRSVTAPIAMPVSVIIGSILSLTAIITIITGIVGAAFASFTLDLLRLRKMSARGFAIGLSSHGTGTARAMSRNETAGVFAAVAMGLSGIVTVLIVPLFILLSRI